MLAAVMASPCEDSALAWAAGEAAEFITQSVTECCSVRIKACRHPRTIDAPSVRGDIDDSDGTESSLPGAFGSGTGLPLSWPVLSFAGPTVSIVGQLSPNPRTVLAPRLRC
jgi:hypothetical protein